MIETLPLTMERTQVEITVKEEPNDRRQEPETNQNIIENHWILFFLEREDGFIFMC